MRAFAVLGLLAFLSTAEAQEQRAFIRTVPDAATFERYSRVIGADRLSKFLIDVKSKEIFFFDVNLYRMHSDFVFSQFYGRPMRNEDINEYNLNYDEVKPRFIMGYLTHHLKDDLWTFSFWEGDEISANDIRWVCRKLTATFYQKGIAFRPDSPLQEKRLAQLAGMRTITNDKIYKLANYQAFNKGKAIGPLRVVAPGTPYESLVFDRQDIVLLQDSYPDIAPVAGIMTTTFSTPLSHVNLRAREWGIPNMGLKDAGKRYASLAGQVVVLDVTDLEHTLRPATAEEVKAWKARVIEAKVVRIPAADLAVKELRSLDKIRAADARIYGTKTANLGEIVSARLLGVPVPEGFGVPFAYYVAHMKRHKLDVAVSELLADPRFASDAAWRKDALAALRTQITAAKLDPKTLATIEGLVRKRWGDRGVFFRSSTNAEDLEGFNGAGLYDTVPNVRGGAAMEAALKQVWASLWNYHAVEARSFAAIDHKGVYAGVLVQVGVDATAAGVLITKNLFDNEDVRSYTINAKRGLGLRVVGGTTVPEQIVYDTGNFGTKIISRSDDPTMLVFDEHGGVREVPNPNKDVILSEARAKALSDTVRRFVSLFPARTPLDVEWVLEGDKVWIVQARPYVSR
jgi:Pyruvate phosphate dikinase, AMP/ATP-binding domain